MRSRDMASKSLTCVLMMVVVCCVSYLPGCDAESNNDSFVPFNDSCSASFELRASEHPKAVPAELLLQLARNNRSQLTFTVKACSAAEVLLYGIGLNSSSSRQYNPIAIRVVLGKQNESSSISTFTDAIWTASIDSTENSLSCDSFQTFGIRWQEGRLQVWLQENNTNKWRLFLQLNSTVRMQGVFGAYILRDETGSDNSSVSSWRFDGPCAETVDTPSMVTRGHLAGAVIVSLVAGIIIGVLCLKYGPKLIDYIRRTLAHHKEDKRRAADEQTQDELSTLVEVQSSNPDKDSKQQQTPTPVADLLALPGDDPPPSSAISSSSAPAGNKRKASNTYTPYHEMGATTSKADSAAKTAADKKAPQKTAPPRKENKAGSTSAPPRKESKTGSTSAPPRKESKAGSTITSIPLPPLPGDDVDTAATSAAAAPDEVYVNADAHIYEGMRHEAPIYENRNTGEYEAFQPGST